MKAWISYVIFSVLIIAGITLYLVQTNCQVGSFWFNATGSIASVLLLGGILSLLYQILSKKQEENRLLKLLKISFSIHDSGLREIHTDSTRYDYSELIKMSDTFIAVMNDGQRWVGNHSTCLQYRFDRRGTLTEFYFVDPKTDFCKALAKKVGAELDYIQNKINMTIGLLRSTYDKSSKNGELKIYFLKNYPTQTIFLTESIVVVTPYQANSGRHTIPVFEYEYKDNKISIGHYIRKDVDNVREESTLIYNSSNP